jgi:hypothetical protein
MKAAGWLLGILIAIPILAAKPCAAQAQEGSPAVKTQAPAQPADAGTSAAAPLDDTYITTLSPAFFKHILLDQKAIWTSPAKVRGDDAVWLVPLGGLAATLFVTDRETSGHLNMNKNTLNRYDNISTYGAYAMVGVGGGLYVLGYWHADDQKRETALLSGEAAIDSLAVTESLKYTLGRARPFQENGAGDFWQGGTSFPSEHSAIAWSIAGILAHEYPGPLTEAFSYGMASLISVSRIKARQHFPSDVLVGSAIGWLTSEYVYRTHHDPELGGAAWERFPIHSEQGSWKPNDMGSPYVPLDSWIYPALDRLRGLGYLDTAIQGLRPWTRRECARLVAEASDRIHAKASTESEAANIYLSLLEEFSKEVAWLSGGNNGEARLDEVYTRFTEISGKPLNDSYHFGQTIIDDFGRPYGEGLNNVTGISGWTTEGPFVVYVRGEYQHAASTPSLPESALQLIPQLDFGLPAAPSTTATGTLNRLRLLDAYAGINFHDWQITFGQQSQWWGPGDGGPAIFSDNAEPIRMFEISRITPFRLPWIFSLIGPIRTEFFVGQLAGQHWLFGPQGFVGGFGTLLNPQPYLLGQKISFKPTKNLEFGISRTTIFSGQSVPFTAQQFFRALFSGSDAPPTSLNYPGDRRSEFDFSYRPPRLRNWVTIYADGLIEDGYSPVIHADQSAWNSGIYISHLPWATKMDLRAEGTYTDVPAGLTPGSFYSNNRYHSGYTNLGNIIGSWVGRDGQGAQAWTNYWFTPRRSVQVNFRHEKVSKDFLPMGGTLTDVGIQADMLLNPHLSISGGVKYEDWLFPVIAAGAQKNVATSLQVTFWPESWGRAPN